MDYRFQHGQGDELKVFFFAEDGSYISGWSRAGQATHAHPERTETENLYDRLVEVDEQLPLSYTVPLTLQEHLDKFEDEPDRRYEFQLAGRDMVITDMYTEAEYPIQLFTNCCSSKNHGLYLSNIKYKYGAI